MSDEETSTVVEEGTLIKSEKTTINGEEVDDSFRESIVLKKRTMVGQVARISMTANLERSKDYGNKAGISCTVTLPCYPNEVFETIQTIEKILEETLAEQVEELRAAVEKLTSEADRPIKTKRGTKKE